MKAWKFSTHEVSFEKSVLMGVLNVTPDSFSDGGKFESVEAAFAHAEKLVEDGANILDLGAESTRPGAKTVSSDEQIKRLLPVLEKVKKLPTLISIDTTQADVAEACLKAGAHIINDVSGLFDSKGELASVVAHHQAGLILMHRRGTAETMQEFTSYSNLFENVLRELERSFYGACQTGVNLNSIVIDPGLGFSKTAEQSLELLKGIDRFFELGQPVLLGHSKKSFIGKAINREVNEREFGDAACVAYAWMKGIRFFRVHDIRATRDVLNMLEAIDSADRLSVKS